ncbi:1-acyl-sn-glycerol-3-phosphate acyltransferase, partial [Escherichia coli]
ALVCLSWLPFAAVLHPILPRRIGQRLGRLAIMVGFRIYLRILTLLCACRFDLSALDALRDERSLIIAPNHPSLLDAVVLASRLPHAVCVMKAS